MIRLPVVTLLFSLALAATPVSAWTPEELRALRADAEAGDRDAQAFLARTLESTDKAEAIRWYRKAAEQGQPNAQTSLGFVYLNGEGGLARDDAEAARWYLKAAEQGERLARWQLAWMSMEGRGVPQDEGEALKWYESLIADDEAESEDEGSPIARMARSQVATIYSRRGTMHEMGIGVPADRALGYFWTSRAAALDPDLYAETLGAEARRMNSDQRAAAATRIRDWASAPGHEGLDKFAPALSALKAVDEALEAARAEAERGDAAAKALLAQRFESGKDLPADPSEAAVWCRRAAEAGDVESMFQMATRSRYGRGIPEDDAAAIDWYRKAAEAGHVESLYRLGEVHQMGLGVPVDPVESVRWYRRAAERNHPLGIYALGEHLAGGRGTPKDEAEGARWIRRAAEMGIETAQWEIGDIYASGRGVTKDPIEALFWLGLAARGGTEEEGLRETVAEGLTPEQLAAIEARIDAWIAAHPEPEDD